MADIRSLCDTLDSVVRRETEGRAMSVAFSGGLDSGIVAALTSRYASSTVLYTVGKEGCHDIRNARELSAELGLELREIPLTEEDMLPILREIMSISGTTNPLTLAFETPLFCVCKACPGKKIIGGQGADEMFAGYSKYIGLRGDVLRNAIASDMSTLMGPTFGHERKVATSFGAEIIYPYLDGAMHDVVSSLDITELESSEPSDRKRVLKMMASELGIPLAATKEKKAAQYGSGAMDLYGRVAKDRGMRFSELVVDIAGELGI